MKQLPDRLVIYSVGENGKDDGGMVAMVQYGSPPDFGFRLWNVNQRRQQPAEPAEAPK